MMGGVRPKLILALAVTSAVVLDGLLWLPERSTGIRLAMVLCAAVLAITPALRWPTRRVRLGTLIAAAVVLSPLAMPLRSGGEAALTQRYLEALRSFEGTRYVWGGETRRGIDCSGFVRQGLVGATAGQAVAGLDPGLLRASAALWWFDASAQALKDGYRGWTVEVARAPSLNALAPGVARPGDLAVTADGRHVLASLGEGRSIQADPLPMLVHSGAAPDVEEPWFKVPVVIVRWRLLVEK